MLIGFAGYMGCGKTTLATALCDEYSFTRVSFAHPLKEMLTQLLRARTSDALLINRMLYGDLKNVPSPLLEGKSPRQALQWLGTEWGRDLIGTNLWTNTALDTVKMSGRDVVIDDVRFPNEVDAIRRAGGVTIWVHRDGVERQSAHESEALTRGHCDGGVVNDANPVDRVGALLEHLSRTAFAKHKHDHLAQRAVEG